MTNNSFVILLQNWIDQLVVHILINLSDWLFTVIDDFEIIKALVKKFGFRHTLEAKEKVQKVDKDAYKQWVICFYIYVWLFCVVCYLFNISWSNIKWSGI